MGSLNVDLAHHHVHHRVPHCVLNLIIVVVSWTFIPHQYNSRMMLTFECDDQNTDGQLSCIPNHCQPHHPDPDPDPDQII